MGPPLPTQLGENEVQAAIRGALEVYADRLGTSAQFFEPYANQQGAMNQRFAADLLAILDNSRVLMLEVKALDIPSYKLRSFDPAQYAYCCALEDKGIPIAYAYNTTAHLAYYDVDRHQKSWPTNTLKAIHRAKPKILPGEAPYRDHVSLLSWLVSNEGGGIARQLGWVLGSGAARPRALTNAAMALIYSAKRKKLLSFNPRDARSLISTLDSMTDRRTDINAQYASLLREFDQAFNECQHLSDTDSDTNNGGKPRPPPRQRKKPGT